MEFCRAARVALIGGEASKLERRKPARKPRLMSPFAPP